MSGVSWGECNSTPSALTCTARPISPTSHKHFFLLFFNLILSPFFPFHHAVFFFPLLLSRSVRVQYISRTCSVGPCHTFYRMFSPHMHTLLHAQTRLKRIQTHIHTYTLRSNNHFHWLHSQLNLTFLQFLIVLTNIK